MTAMISTVPREHINNVWPTVAPELDRAIKRTHGRFHSVDILTSLLEGMATLWIAIRDKEIIGSLIFVISEFPSGMKVGRIDYIAGKDRDDWLKEIWDTVVEYAKEMNCDAIELVARPGIVPYVESWGAKKTGTLMEYNLKEKRDG